MYIYYIIIIGFVFNVITFIFISLTLAIVFVGKKKNALTTKFKMGDKVFYSESDGQVEFGTIVGVTAVTQRTLPKSVSYKIENYDKGIAYVSERQVNKYYG